MLLKKLCILFFILILTAPTAFAACPNASTSGQGSTCSQASTCNKGATCNQGSTCSQVGTCTTSSTKAATAASVTACTADFKPVISGGKLVLKNTCTGAYTACYWKAITPQGKVIISRDCNPSLPLIKGRWYVYFNPKFSSCGWSKDIAKRFTVS